MIDKVWAIKNIKVHYVKAILNLMFQKFTIFVLKVQKWDDKYKGYIIRQYYLFLTKDPLCNQFMKTFLELDPKKKNKI